MPKRVIILAAGIGSRLRPLTDHMPKCCVPVGGESLIKRIVQQLRACDTTLPITVVAGYRAAQVAVQLTENSVVGAPVEIIVNENYLNTNNMESCRLALMKALSAAAHTAHDSDTDRSTLIINGDCIYDSAIVRRMHKQHSAQSCIAIDSTQYYEESMKVHVEHGHVTDISKALPETPDNLTSIDFYHFSPTDTQRLLTIMQAYHDKGEHNFWTEVAIRDLVQHHPQHVTAVDMSGHHWVEIDNHDDLTKATRLWAALEPTP